MKRWLPHPILTPILVAIWLLLNNSLAPGQILLGAFLGWAIPRYTIDFWPEQVHIRSPLLLLKFIGIFLYDVLIANLSVARLILTGPRSLCPVFVVVPLELRNDFAISLLANIICLTPGTVSARLSADQRELLIHALDAASPDALVADIKSRFEAPLKEIFE